MVFSQRTRNRTSKKTHPTCDLCRSIFCYALVHYQEEATRKQTIMHFDRGAPTILGTVAKSGNSSLPTLAITEGCRSVLRRACDDKFSGNHSGSNAAKKNEEHHDCRSGICTSTLGRTDDREATNAKSQALHVLPEHHSARLPLLSKARLSIILPKQRLRTLGGWCE